MALKLLLVPTMASARGWSVQFGRAAWMSGDERAWPRPVIRPLDVVRIVTSAILVGVSVVCCAVDVAHADGVVSHGDPGAPVTDVDESRELIDMNPFMSMTVNAQIALEDVRDLARAAVPEAEKRVGRFEEYVVIEGSVLSSTLVDRRDVRPRLFPYASYIMDVKRAVGIGTELEPASELEVVAMWPPVYRNGGVGGGLWSHGRDPRVPLSTGLRVIAIGFRSPQGRGSSSYHRELWPRFHIVFAVVADQSGGWYAIEPDASREYDMGIAKLSGVDAPVALHAWRGVARPISDSVDSLFQVLVDVATEASEQ